ncbi:hypothetical protein V5O48_002102 [Marasmius crinis-equi]|uniref:Protein SMG7 n=1 Tax=Marasmius crinis-equi TaxID=585013 RepID=A0ABR3FWM4_9AGAR
MADQPSTIVREAKGTYQTVKELLKNREPFDKELDFQRKKRYLNLLLVHPYAHESKDAETRLWMETSHAFISSYKQRISHLDRTIQRQRQQGQQGANQTHPNQRGGHGPVEHRKLIQRFRQFLAEEEKFWAQFVVRFSKDFDLAEAHSTLLSLGIVTEELTIKELPSRNEGGDGGAGASGLPHNGGRNHFQFPTVPEGSESLVPQNDAQKESRMEILSKALTCLGDIARYREQYNEAGGRPRAGYEDHSGPGKREARSKKGVLVPEIPRPRNYEKARHCYEQAKLLVPYEGNPSHQLAILASYQKDVFTSLVHYYRALCVRHPYESASDNIHTTLHKAIEQWKVKSKNDPAPEAVHAMPKIRVDAFKDKMVVLHGLYRLGLEKDSSLTIKQAQEVFSEFYRLVSDRFLPEDFIIQVIVLSQAALWKYRMIRDSPKPSKNGDKHSTTPATATLPSTVIEARLFTHVLSLHRALMEVGIEQLKEPVPIGADGDLAQRIMVEFRRTLPALRIASKWLLANFKLVMQDPESLGAKNGKGGKRAQHKTTGQISPSSIETIEFWEKYAEFLRALSRAFPSNKLPDLTFALSEDIEMRGFLPLKGMLDAKNGEGMKERDGTSGSAGTIDEVPTEEKEVHPNVVQLMRIKDLLNDAKKIIDMENSPLTIYGNQFMLKGVEAQAQPVPISDPIHLSDIEDDSDAILNPTTDQDSVAGETSRTDDVDDPIREAFSHLDDEDEEDEDEDEIVWNPRASPTTSPKLAVTPPVARVSPVVHGLSPAAAPYARPVHTPIVPPTVSPVVQPPISPPRVLPAHSPPKTSKTTSPLALTTAEDLLNGFMAPRLSPSARVQPRIVSDPLTSSTPLLFGDRAGNNIWSASQDEQVSMRISASTNQQHTFHHSPISPGQERLRTKSHSQWPPSPSAMGHVGQPMTTQNPTGGIPPALSSPSHFVGQHRRAPSSSAVAAQLFPDPVRNPGLSEYGYGSPSAALNQQTMPHQLMEPDVFHHSYGQITQHSLGPGSGSIYDSAVPNHQGYNNGIAMNNHHTRHLSMHDSRMSAQSFAPPAMPPLWGGAG